MLAAAGCQPGMQTIRPGASGIVVDQATGAPIVGAAVEIEGPLKWSGGTYKTGKRTGKAQATTGKDGRFNIPQQQVVGRPLGTSPDDDVFPFKLSVEQKGYSHYTNLFDSTGFLDVGTISLSVRK